MTQFRPYDRVRINKVANPSQFDFTEGFANTWVHSMNERMGNEEYVDCVSTSGVRMVGKPHSFPPGILTLIRRAAHPNAEFINRWANGEEVQLSVCGEWKHAELNDIVAADLKMLRVAPKYMTIAGRTIEKHVDPDHVGECYSVNVELGCVTIHTGLPECADHRFFFRTAEAAKAYLDVLLNLYKSE